MVDLSVQSPTCYRGSYGSVSGSTRASISLFRIIYEIHNKEILVCSSLDPLLSYSTLG